MVFVSDQLVRFSGFPEFKDLGRFGDFFTKRGMSKAELFFPLASQAEKVANSGSYVDIVKRLTTTSTL